MGSKSEKQGDLQAYVQLMTEHQGRLRAFIVSLIPGSPDVADILQETNAALWQKRARFKMGTNFLAWAFQMARHEISRQRARNGRAEQLAFSAQVMDAISSQAVNEDSNNERMEALENCLGKLSDGQREIVFERYTPGKSLENYAEQTGRSAGALRIALYRIRESLKLCIENSLTKQS